MIEAKRTDAADATDATGEADGASRRTLALSHESRPVPGPIFPSTDSGPGTGRLPRAVRRSLPTGMIPFLALSLLPGCLIGDPQHPGKPAIVRTPATEPAMATTTGPTSRPTTRP